MPIHRRRGRGWIPIATSFVAGFIAGVVFIGYLNARGTSLAALADDCGDPEVEVRPSRAPAAPRLSAPPRSAESPPRPEPDAIADLRSRKLTLPVKGLDRKDLRSSFDDARGEGRHHEALDILAPRNTPVLAVEDGTIARLFTSKAGGLTIYQFDPESTYTYYYAHLERYADGLKEGARIERGHVIGYVGTSGNAPPGTPHLHFAIFKLNDEKKWWQGTALDPYAVFR